MQLVIIFFVNYHQYKITHHGKSDRKQHLADQGQKKNGQYAVQDKIKFNAQIHSTHIYNGSDQRIKNEIGDHTRFITGNKSSGIKPED